MLFADAALAGRLEAAEAANARCHGAEVLEIAGGCAIFAGVGSPLTQAVGLGLNGPVSGAELDRLEAFFRERGAGAVVDLCPLAGPGFVEELSRRGYQIREFNNVLVRKLAGLQAILTPRVRRATADECDVWARSAGQGFFEQPELTAEEMNIGRAVFGMERAICYLATVESGELAGSAALSVRGGLATLFADSSIPRFRRRGVHRELIDARLNDAVALGCDLATASTLPGSESQRNYERAGFEVVYTKVTMGQ